MIHGPADYLLKFPDQQSAVQFGLKNGYCYYDDQGQLKIRLATTEFALCVIGQYQDANWWVIFADLVGLDLPAGSEAFIVWASWFTKEIPDPEDPEKTIIVPVPRPTDDSVPNQWWA